MSWEGCARLSCTLDRNVEDLSVLSFASGDMGHKLVADVEIDIRGGIQLVCSAVNLGSCVYEPGRHTMSHDAVTG